MFQSINRDFISKKKKKIKKKTYYSSGGVIFRNHNILNERISGNTFHIKMFFVLLRFDSNFHVCLGVCMCVKPVCKFIG